jgi:hypothetical protein
MMSSSYRRSLKELHAEKHKAKQHPTNVRSHQLQDITLTDAFCQEPVSLSCLDCGANLTDKSVRWVEKEGAKIPYCRGCFLTRFGKAVSKETES